MKFPKYRLVIMVRFVANGIIKNMYIIYVITLIEGLFESEP